MFASITSVVAASVLLSCSVYFTYQQRKAQQTKQLQRAEDELHPQLKKHTSFRSYTTSHAFYPRVRTFYRPHEHREKHRDIEDLPLLVFIHGIGGVLPQFAPLLQSFTNIGPCFGLELPGHGRSAFAPREYEAYTIEANATLWKTAIQETCEAQGHKAVVLIGEWMCEMRWESANDQPGHSLGCSIAALLASEQAGSTHLSVPVLGMVSICPRARSLTEKEVKAARTLIRAPDFVINILRWVDRRRGVDSNSVLRVVGKMKEPDLRHLQLQWNTQFKTQVLKRITSGLLPRRTADGGLVAGYPSNVIWQGIRSPLLLIAGESDQITPAAGIGDIVIGITHESLESWKDKKETEEGNPALQATNGLIPTTIQYEAGERRGTIQAVILPAPASHALLYGHTTYRLVSALIESFLTKHVSEKLDFSYQLRLLTTSGKWDVKNLAKWKEVLPVSGPINTNPEHGGCEHGLFRALKTMREQDDEHSPTLFVRRWADQIYAVIDISHDTPIYNTKTLDEGGIEYHKFATVSKIPPTPLEVQDFGALVDRLITERDAKNDNRSIAVHCHYGYNRTGFFIASYLISRNGYGIQQALEEFAAAKPPGIKHEHFKDQLWLRFASASHQTTTAAHSATHKIQLEVDQKEDELGTDTDGDLM